MSNLDWLSHKINDLKKEGLYNDIRLLESSVDSLVTINGRKYLNFCSNNYLGLASDKRLSDAAKNAIDKYGVGPAAVRTIAGTSVLHQELEKKLAEFKKVEDVITLQGGFLANLATIPALVGECDIIFSDELNHASIIDACRLSKAKVVRYSHSDAADLENKISKEDSDGKKALVVTDGVFSMDGDIAPLPSLLEVAKKYGAILMVDDAHGEGVLGENGRGIVDHFGLHGQVDVEVGTLSKAFGVVGGFVAGKKVLIDWLRQRARPFLFSSAMTVPDTAASICAVEILAESDILVKKLWKNAKYFEAGMKKMGFDTGNSQTPIIPVILGDAKLAQEFSKELFEEGVFAKAIYYPTVPEGKARIRVMNSASHNKKDLDTALLAFEKVGKKLKVI